MSQVVRVGRWQVPLHHSAKLLYPHAGYTKQDLAEYFRDVAGLMLPHLKQRPLMMQRFPDGLGGEGFYQKDRPAYFPAWIAGARVPRKRGGSITQVVVNHARALVYLADQACLALHLWLSRRDRPARPDRMIFDLDPGPTDFATVRWAARVVKQALEELGLAALVMTTGSRGLHVVTPLTRGPSFDQVRALAHGLAQALAARHPGRLTVEQRKDKRGKRLYLDVMRNGYAQTAVAPYSPRPLPGAPVATPLDWDELASSGLGPQSYNLGNIRRRLGQKRDPWEDFARQARGLAPARQRLARWRD